MKQNRGYEIDFVEGKIIVMKRFLKDASVIGSTAYTELTQVRKDYADFTIEIRQIAKKENKQTYGKLTYDFMRDYILTKEDSKVVLAEYENIRKLAKFQNAQYVFVKNWFLKKYKSDFTKKETDKQVA